MYPFKVLKISRVDASAVKPPDALTKDNVEHVTATTTTTTREPERYRAPTAPKPLIFSRKPVAKPQTRVEPKKVGIESRPLPLEKIPAHQPVMKQQSITASQPKDDLPKVASAQVDLPLLEPPPVIMETAARSQLLGYADIMPAPPGGRASEPLKRIVSGSKSPEQRRPNDKGSQRNPRREDRTAHKSPARTAIITKVVPRSDARVLDKAPVPPQIFRPRPQESAPPKPAQPTHARSPPRIVSKKRPLENSPSKREAETRPVKRTRLVVGMEASKVAADRLDRIRRAEASKPTVARQTSPIQAPQKVRANSSRHEPGASPERPLSRPKVKATTVQLQPTVKKEALPSLVAQLIKEHDVFGSVLENSIDLASIDRLRRDPVEIFESAEPHQPKEATFKEPVRKRSLSPPRSTPSPKLPSTLRGRPSHESFRPSYSADSYKEVEQEEPQAPDAHDGKLRNQRSNFREDEFCTLTVPQSPKFILGRQRHEEEKAEKERGRWSNLARRQKERAKRENVHSMPPVRLVIFIA